MRSNFESHLNRVLTEWVEYSDEALRVVGKLSVSKIYDLNLCDWHIPFIYVSDIPEINFKAKLFFGRPKHTHTEMITDAIGKDIHGRKLDNLDFDPPNESDSEPLETDEEPSAYLYDEYYYDNVPAKKYTGPPTLDRLFMAAYGDGLIDSLGESILFNAAVGRIGIDISNEFIYSYLTPPYDLYDMLRSATVVSYSAQANTPAGVVDACNRMICKTSLPDGQKINEDAFCVMNGKAFHIEEAARPSTEEDIRKGALQKALHIGAWPDGKRLTQKEKFYIRDELGVKKDNSPPLPTFGSERRRLSTKRDPEYPEISRWTASEGYDIPLSDYEFIIENMQFIEEIRVEGKKREVTWVAPDIDEEMAEFELTSDVLNIDLNNLIDAAHDAKLVPLDEFSMWRFLLNTESYQIKKGDLDAVYPIAAKYGRDIESILDVFSQGGTLPAPIVLVRKNLKPYLIGGNTRLMVARAMGVQPKVLKVQL